MKVLQELRESCLLCVLKHLGQAAALMSETRQDYPAHRWLAVGHMAEAAEECCKDYPKLADEIRKHRLRYMTGLDYVVPIVKLIEMASKLAEDVGGCGRLGEDDVSRVLSQLQRLNSGKQGPETAAQAAALRRKLDAAISAREKRGSKKRQWSEERAERCGSVAVSLLKPGTKVYEKWLAKRNRARKRNRQESSWPERRPLKTIKKKAAK